MLDLVNYEEKLKEAIRAFWGNREEARQKQIELGKVDQGERAGVTGGKNMDGFISLIIDIVVANGLENAQIMQKDLFLHFLAISVPLSYGICLLCIRVS